MNTNKTNHVPTIRVPKIFIVPVSENTAYRLADNVEYQLTLKDGKKVVATVGKVDIDAAKIYLNVIMHAGYMNVFEAGNESEYAGGIDIASIDEVHVANVEYIRDKRSRDDIPADAQTATFSFPSNRAEFSEYLITVGCGEFISLSTRTDDRKKTMFGHVTEVISENGSYTVKFERLLSINGNRIIKKIDLEIDSLRGIYRQCAQINIGETVTAEPYTPRVPKIVENAEVSETEATDEVAE